MTQTDRSQGTRNRPDPAQDQATTTGISAVAALDADRSFASVALGALIGLSLAVAGFVVAVSATGLAGQTTSFWYLSRSAGLVAYLLLWGSVVWGLLLSSKIGQGRLRTPVLLDAHQFLSNVAIGFAAFHGLVLMGDRYLSFPVGGRLGAFRRHLQAGAGGSRADRPLAEPAPELELPGTPPDGPASLAQFSLSELRGLLGRGGS